MVMGVIGLILIFMPDETLQFVDQAPNEIFSLVLQLMGALYLGFAILNWMAKNIIIGGIYAKPLSLGNFANFLIGGLTLAKVGTNGKPIAMCFWILAGVYLTLAVAFGFISFTSPKLKVND